MSKRHPCGGVGRRQFLAGAGAGLSALPMLAATRVSAQEKVGAARSNEKTSTKVILGDGSLGLPGPYPGRVVEVRDPSMIKDGVKNRASIKATIAKGLTALTGADDVQGAWKTFVEPGDVVGIKVVPNGFPMVHTSFEIVLEVIEGLKSAGIKTRDMIVFDRYKSEFMDAGYQKILPDGVLWGGETPIGDGSHLMTSFPGNDPVAGYDPDEYMEMNLVHRGHDPKDDRNFRSHLGLIVTRRVNKLILLPVMKDHGSAGVTGCLKNMSHGLVNNVARSHSTPDTNSCKPVHPERRRPPDHPEEVRSPDHGRNSVGLPGRPVRSGEQRPLELGKQRDPVRDRPRRARPRRMGRDRCQAQGKGARPRRLGRQARPGLSA